jgi:hypothetical protein
MQISGKNRHQIGITQTRNTRRQHPETDGLCATRLPAPAPPLDNVAAAVLALMQAERAAQPPNAVVRDCLCEEPQCKGVAKEALVRR